MKTFLTEIKTSLLVTAVMILVVCGVYPLAVWAGGQVLFADKANGSLIIDQDGTIRGSRLLAQNFSSQRFFHPRPSAAGSGYDASSSSGTNLGPTSQKLADRIQTRVADYRFINGLSPDAAVPADAVTSSASGLDPHISVANARLQAARVARVRALSPAEIQTLVSAHTAARDFGVFGEPTVNVLELNLALDAISPASTAR